MNDPPVGGRGPIQAFLLLVIAALLAHAFVQRRRGSLGRLAFCAWAFVWIVGGVAILFPDATTNAARAVGVGRGADLVTYVSLVALFYAVFRLLVRTERTERRVTELVREIALDRMRREETPGPKDGGA